jgi:hypothetical protein
MSEWKQWHIELNEAIEKPSQTQLAEMDKTHFELYVLSQKIQNLKDELAEAEDLFKDLKDTLNPNSLPNWAWIWIKKQSRVAWKQVVIDRLGHTYANKISAEQAQKEYPQIGIQFIDPNPEKIPIDPEKKKRQQKPKRFKILPEKQTPLLKLKLKAK